MYQHKFGNYLHYKPKDREMGRFDVKNEEKTPSDTNKRGKGISSRNNVWREASSGTSKALNAL